MTDTASTYALRLEAAATSGNLSEELQKTSDAIKANMTKEAADKMLQDVSEELYKKGALPKLARSYALANFNDLDLDGNGKISAAELDKMLQTDLLKGATNPFEKQLLRYMQANREKIAAASNDEWGTETNITRKDLTEFEKQRAAADRTAVMSQRVAETFGKRENFRRLDSNNDGFVADAELKAALDGKRGAFTAEERELIQFMRDNRVPIAKSVNDQKLWENKISLKDIEAFAKNNRIGALPVALATARDFSREVTPPKTTADKFLPDLMLDFGKENFRALDHNGDGKVTRVEIQKLSESAFWRRGISENNMKLMSALDNKLEYIQRSHRDEFWYKDRKGMSVKDLEAFAKNEEKNRRDLPTEPGDHKLELTIGGVKRDYVMHIPPGYDGKKPVPVVYMFHYFTGNADEIAKCSALSQKADKEGFIVVYPNAKGWIGNRFRQFNLNNNKDYRVDEIAFVETMMNTIEDKLNVDKDRVYVAGYSNGGMLAQEVATKMSDRVAAMACVGGCLTGKEKKPEYAVSTVLLHGDKDRIVPADGTGLEVTLFKPRVSFPGTRPFTPLFPQFKSLEYARDFWKHVNGTDQSKFDQVAPGINRETYTNSKTGKQVQVYRLNDHGHCYPGDPQPTLDGKPCTTISATDIMWDFFTKNKRTAPSRVETLVPLKK